MHACMQAERVKDHANGKSVIYKHLIGVGDL